MKLTDKEIKDAIRFANNYGRPPKLSDTQNCQIGSKEAQSILNRVKQRSKEGQ